MPRGDAGILGRYSKHSQPADGSIARCGHNELTGSDVKTQRLQQINLGLQQYIPPDNSAISDSMFDIDGNIGGLHKDQTKTAGLVFNNEPARRDGRAGKTEAGAS